MNGFPNSSSLAADSCFIGLALAVYMLLFALGRLLLLFWNRPLARDVPAAAIRAAFITGLRFDLNVSSVILMPLVLGMLLPHGLNPRWLWLSYLVFTASFAALWLLVEAEFYREFQARLNSIVIQYLSEDLKTVLRMVTAGGPTKTFVSAMAGIVVALCCAFVAINVTTRVGAAEATGWLTNYLWRTPVFLILTGLAGLGIRGTLRHGPPLRWGDAFTTSYLFANHLGLNGLHTLFKAWQGWGKDDAAKVWKRFMDREQALALTRELVLQEGDQLLSPDHSPLLRKTTPQGPVLPGVKNVVFVLMESFSSRFVGALGAPGNITPCFDKLAEEGCLCRRMFSVGTHTHQGMFGTVASFPNLPDFEYLMQQPAGSGRFSGFPAMMAGLGYSNNVFVYNGDFAWDNQQGFFGVQGVTRFVGRDDYVNPVLRDRTWGVCDQDMFDRSIEELDKLNREGGPFYALLQTLSNHLPYAMPADLPVEEVTAFGDLNRHLTAMRYSDWALGRFFDQAKTRPWYGRTLFVTLGDHGFGVPGQVSSMNLQRFHVPALFLAPGIQAAVGRQFDKSCSQLDMASTAVSLLGRPFVQAGWGRNIFALDPQDPGYAILKPSGSDKTVAMVYGEEVIVKGPGIPAELYRIDLGFPPSDQLLNAEATDNPVYRQLGAFLETAVICLAERKTGHDIAT